MLRAAYQPGRDSFSLRVAGHAGYAPRGEDIVCAAASILVYALAQTLAALETDGFARYSFEPDGAEDGLVLRAVPAAKTNEAAGALPRVQGAFEMAAAGFALLAEKYPGCVHYTENVPATKKEEPHA